MYAHLLKAHSLVSSIIFAFVYFQY